MVTATGSFLWLSDIHLDPYYSTPQAVHHGRNGYNPSDCISAEAFPLGQIGCDTPYSLWESTIQQAMHAKNIDFVIVTGDFVRHRNEQLEPGQTREILFNVSSRLATAFPDLPIVPSIGNNDVRPDYQFDVVNPTEVLTMLSSGLAPILPDDDTTFAQGGYTYRDLEVANGVKITVLTLNTLVYSKYHTPDQSSIEDPMGQFQWLSEQLQRAQGEARFVYIIGHIAPTIDSFEREELWREGYARRYYDILANFETIIRGQLFGHIHTEEFRTHGPWGLFLSPSVTPVYGTNPSFRVVTFDAGSGTLLDYETQYLELYRDGVATNHSIVEWDKTKQTFRQVYKVSDMGVDSLRTIVERLKASSTSPDWDNFLGRQDVFAKEVSCPPVPCRQQWICTLEAFSTFDYETCLQNITAADWSSTASSESSAPTQSSGSRAPTESPGSSTALDLSLWPYALGVTILVLALVVFACRWKRKYYGRQAIKEDSDVYDVPMNLEEKTTPVVSLPSLT